jgi:hypothetical protein
VNNDDKEMKGASPAPFSAAAEGQGKKEDWIGRHLRRVFDDSLSEPLPDDILSLLDRLDDGPADASKHSKDAP